MKNMKTEKTVGGKMNVINLKSRKIQIPEKYVELLENLYRKDPLVKLQGNKYISLESLHKDEILEQSGIPRIMYGKLSTYDLLDPDAFYNRRKKEQVDISLDPDIVANVKDIEFYFIPVVHRMVFKSNGKISLNQVEKYFIDAFNLVEGEGEVDVTIIKDRDVIERILTADKIFSLKASITYSNKDFSNGFVQLFDQKSKESEVYRMDINMISSKAESLNAKKDGLVEAIVETSQSNGTVEATVLEKSSTKRTKINTKDYPMRIELKSRESCFFSDIYSQICGIFGNK